MFFQATSAITTTLMIAIQTTSDLYSAILAAMDASDPQITNVKHVSMKLNTAIATLDVNVQDARNGHPQR